MDDELISKLIDGGRILAAEGLQDFTRGHISVRTGADPSRFYMKPHGFGFEEMTHENVVTCNLEGEKVAGNSRRHSEVFIHSEILKVRPDLNSVIHFHSTYSVALAATGQEMKTYSQPAALFAGRLPTFSDTVDLIRQPEQGRGVALALGPHKAVLLRGHGAVVAGETIDESVNMAIMLEASCKIQLLVDAVGTSAPPPDAEDVARLFSKISRADQFEVNFEYLRRRLPPRA